MHLTTDLVARGDLTSPVAVAAFETLEKRVERLEEFAWLAVEHADLERRRADLECERADRLEKEKAGLEARIRDLEARLATDSTNSSKPPSSDPPHTKRYRRRAKKKEKKRGGAKRGARPGHEGRGRALAPPERVDAVVDHRPEACRHCGHALAGRADVGTPGRWQLVELPPMRAHITEHRTYARSCPDCGLRTRAPLPTEIRTSHFGPRLAAFATLLMSRFRLSRRKASEFLGELLDVAPPSPGTTQAFVHEASAALLPAYREVRTAVRASEVCGADETAWTLRGESRWLWAAVTGRAAFFRIGRRRSARQRELLLGRRYAGILTTDRWRAYDAHPPERRQLCWAHLKRNFQQLVERGGAAASTGRWGVAECGRLFGAWQHFAAGDIDRTGLLKALRPIRARFRRLLRCAEASEDRKARAIGRDLTRLWPALWTFLRHAGVEPTNNRTERALRDPVIGRKLSFGSQSGPGLRATERLLTFTHTCRTQGKNLLDHLTASITAYRRGSPPPRLLPAD